MLTCRPRGDHRYLTGHHDDTCTDTRCRGCQPCPETHCELCKVEHCDFAYPRTCAKCVGRVRNDLREITGLTRRLRDQAANGGVNGRLIAALDIPGGDALVLIAPTAEPVGHMRQMFHRQELDLDVTHLDDELSADPDPPRNVFAELEQHWRHQLGQPRADGPVSLHTSWRYLDQQITRAAQTPGIEFADTAHDVAAVRRRLEALLRDGDRLQTGAPCVRCSRSLVRVTDATGGLTDRWKCPQCAQRYTRDQYANAVTDSYRRMQMAVLLSPYGRTVWATLPRAAAEVGRGQPALRKAVAAGVIARCCVLVGRREMVSLDDARRWATEERRLARERRSA